MRIFSGRRVACDGENDPIELDLSFAQAHRVALGQVIISVLLLLVVTWLGAARVGRRES